jgi:hypothetical protein
MDTPTSTLRRSPRVAPRRGPPMVSRCARRPTTRFRLWPDAGGAYVGWQDRRHTGGGQTELYPNICYPRERRPAGPPAVAEVLGGGPFRGDLLNRLPTAREPPPLFGRAERRFDDLFAININGTWTPHTWSTTHPRREVIAKARISSRSRIRDADATPSAQYGFTGVTTRQAPTRYSSMDGDRTSPRIPRRTLPT